MSTIAERVASRFLAAQDEQEKEAVSPPGWDKSVERMKKHKDIDNPFALAWYMHNKGDKPHPKKKEAADWKLHPQGAK